MSGKLRHNALRRRPTTVADDRRRFAEKRLADLGIALGRGGLAATEISTARLRWALVGLGPLFVLFGRYLASRPDLVAEPIRSQLAHLPQDTPPLSRERVVELLRAELGEAAVARFDTIEPRPLVSTPVYQRHHAVLTGGEQVAVEVIRPGIETEIEENLDSLRALAVLGADGPDGSGILDLDSAIEDFATALTRALDLAGEMRALAALETGNPGRGRLVIPRPYPELSGHRVLTRERLGGTALTSLFPRLRHAPAAPRDGDDEQPAAGELFGDELACELARVWLGQAVGGRLFPTELTAADVRILPGYRIGWTCGPFARLQPGSGRDLLEYLAAAADQDPDGASSTLVQLTAREEAGSERELRRRMRQLVPFRDGGPGATDDLAGYLFLHWETARRTGFRSPPALVELFRGLVHLVAVIRPLGRRRDPLKDGLEACRVSTDLELLLATAGPERLATALEPGLHAFATLPQKLDRLFDLAASGKLEVTLRTEESPREERRRDLAAWLLALLATAGGLALVAQRLAGSGASWGEPVAAALVVVCGVLVLTTIRRWR